MHARLVVPMLLLAAAAACGDSTGPNGNNISVEDNTFKPNAMTVAVGTTVTWTWDAGNAHNVTWVGSGTASATQTSGSYQRTFDTAGAFQYFCTIHGTASSGMRGTVTVQ